jgi:hypothetical protein
MSCILEAATHQKMHDSFQSSRCSTTESSALDVQSRSAAEPSAIKAEEKAPVELREESFTPCKVCVEVSSSKESVQTKITLFCRLMPIQAVKTGAVMFPACCKSTR